MTRARARRGPNGQTMPLAEFERREREEWPIFEARVRAAPTVVEAYVISQTGVGPDLPGRCYYSNLATWIISEFDAVNGASAAEWSLYRELLERSVAAGVLKPEVLTRTTTTQRKP